MKNVFQFFKDRWATSGWPVILGGLASGSAVFAVYMTFMFATGLAHAETVTANTIVSSGTQTITIDAIGNGNVVIKDSTTVQGNLSATQLIKSDGLVQGQNVTATYGLTAAGGKFNVAGDTGTVNVGNGKIVLNGANGNASVNGVALLNGGAYIGPRVEGGSLPALTVNGQGAFKGINNAGQKITGVGAGNVNATSADAVNGAQLNAVNERLTGQVQRIDGQVVRLDGQVQRVDGLVTKTDATNGRVTVVEGKVVDLRTDLGNETSARIEGDKRVAAEANSYADAGDAATLSAAQSYADAGDRATLNQANSYADAGDRRTLGQANAYTDSQIGAVRQEIGQVRKHVDAVGAVAMAASVVGGVSVADGKKNAVTAAVGNYGSATAIAVGITRIVAPNARVFGTISRSSGSKTGVGAGASFSF